MTPLLAWAEANPALIELAVLSGIALLMILCNKGDQK